MTNTLSYTIEFINQSGILIPLPTGAPILNSQINLFENPNNFITVEISTLLANNSVGSNGNVLTTNGNTIYWANKEVYPDRSISAIWDSQSYPSTNDSVVILPFSPNHFSISSIRFYTSTNGASFNFNLEYKNTFSDSISIVPGLSNIHVNSTLGNTSPSSPFTLPLNGTLQITILDANTTINSTNSFIIVSGYASSN